MHAPGPSLDPRPTLLAEQTGTLLRCHVGTCSSTFTGEGIRAPSDIAVRAPHSQRLRIRRAISCHADVGIAPRGYLMVRTISTTAMREAAERQRITGGNGTERSARSRNAFRTVTESAHICLCLRHETEMMIAIRLPARNLSVIRYSGCRLSSSAEATAEDWRQLCTPVPSDWARQRVIAPRVVL